MADNSRKVIGYCAFASPTEVICTGDQGEACVISGSVRAMKAFLKEIDPDGQKAHTVKKKTRFGEILRGLGKDIHVSCGQAFDVLWVITVYEPDAAEWVDPRTRRVVK
jgi:hypothetical protein